MVQIIGIDPGSQESGYVLYQGGRVLESETLTNEDLLDTLNLWSGPYWPDVAIEMIEHYGPDISAGRTTFETCVWIGRFQQVSPAPGDVLLIPRREIKLALCGSPLAKDKNIRQAIIDRVGPKGTKKAPGPTYGVSGHMWQALAVAVVAEDRLRAKVAA